jgi:plasmid stabilization system protein ParE
MKEYAVVVTEITEAALNDHALYIAVERQEPLNAARWLENTFDAIQTLKTFPKRCPLAEESDDVSYEVRKLQVGSPVLLFTVDDDRRTVWVIAFRGEGQLPRPQDLRSPPPSS